MVEGTQDPSRAMSTSPPAEAPASRYDFSGQSGKRPPLYRCHKKVRALKIAAAERLANGQVRCDFATEDFPPATLDRDTASRFKFTDDDTGYLVIYDDGYVSWSPSQAFEAGYKRIEEA